MLCDSYSFEEIERTRTSVRILRRYALAVKYYAGMIVSVVHLTEVSIKSKNPTTKHSKIHEQNEKRERIDRERELDIMKWFFLVKINYLGEKV